MYVSADNEITSVIDRNTIGDNDIEDDFIITGLSARAIGQVSSKDANSSPKSSSDRNSHRGGEFHLSVESGTESIAPTDGKLSSGKYSSNTFEFDGSSGHEIVHEGTTSAKFNGIHSNRELNVKVDQENVRNVHPAPEKCDCYGSGDVCYSLESAIRMQTSALKIMENIRQGLMKYRRTQTMKIRMLTSVLKTIQNVTRKLMKHRREKTITTSMQTSTLKTTQNRTQRRLKLRREKKKTKKRRKEMKTRRNGLGLTAAHKHETTLPMKSFEERDQRMKRRRRKIKKISSMIMMVMMVVTIMKMRWSTSWKR